MQLKVTRLATSVADPEVPKTTPKGQVGGGDTIGRNIKVLGENGKVQNEAQTSLVVILIHKWLTNVAKQTAQTTDEIQTRGLIFFFLKV